jgi:hypothetical protein
MSAEFVHEGRASNVDAHNLARSSVYRESGRLVWLLSPLKAFASRFLESSINKE